MAYTCKHIVTVGNGLIEYGVLCCSTRWHLFVYTPLANLISSCLNWYLLYLSDLL